MGRRRRGFLQREKAGVKGDFYNGKKRKEDGKDRDAGLECWMGLGRLHNFFVDRASARFTKRVSI